MILYKHFDFTNDTNLDTNYWNVAVGDKWSNAELQRYVDSKENLYFAGYARADKRLNRQGESSGVLNGAYFRSVSS